MSVTWALQRIRSSFVSVLLFVAIFATPARGQVNSGSDGSDGALNVTNQPFTIDMHDHPTGIYQYTSVNIPNNFTVSIVPNDANTPLVWLVQGDCTIGGIVAVDGKKSSNAIGVAGGPGGLTGGTGVLGQGAELPGAGFGPGGGKVIPGPPLLGGQGSYGTIGAQQDDNRGHQYPPGDLYGNQYLIPLIGGSGGGGSSLGGGGGGGGAILIAASGTITISGSINANGGNGFSYINWNIVYGGGGGGSGGSIRLVATSISGTGSLNTAGGGGVAGWNDGYFTNSAGTGRIRLDSYSDSFVGGTNGTTTRGMTGIVLLPSNQAPRLRIANVAGVAVPGNPIGLATNPDVIIPGLQSNPINIVVNCENVAVGSTITVDVKPANGAIVTASAQNTGTTGSSTAVVSVNMPRGGGTIQARTTTPVVLASATEDRTRKGKKPSVYETGLAINGERFARAEITSEMGGHQQVVYITDSGKRFPLGAEIKKPTAPKQPAKKG